jgi:hypothetical protein
MVKTKKKGGENIKLADRSDFYNPTTFISTC